MSGGQGGEKTERKSSPPKKSFISPRSKITPVSAKLCAFFAPLPRERGETKCHTILAPFSSRESRKREQKTNGKADIQYRRRRR